MLVSIYLPTKNRLGQLRDAVNSVLAQTYQNIELIVVDDGSSDGTLEYLGLISSSESRVRYISHVNSVGAPSCRNEAIRASNGYFVTGLDDDDQFDPYRIESFVLFWNWCLNIGAPTAFLYSQEKWLVNGSCISTTCKSGNVTKSDLSKGNAIGNQIFAPKSSYLAAGMFNESLAAWQDLEFLIRVIDRVGQGRLVDFPTYLFDVTPRRNRISSDEKRIRQAFEVVASLHFSKDNRARQHLFLQLFSNYYKFRPGYRDFVFLLRDGFWPQGLLILARALRSG